MKKSLSLAIGLIASSAALAVIVAVAGPIVFTSVTNTSTDVPTVMPTAYAEAPAVTISPDTDLSGQWSVSDGSTLGCSLVEQTGSQAPDADPDAAGVAAELDASTSDVTGSVTVSGSALSAAHITADINSLVSTSQAGFPVSQLTDAHWPAAILRLTDGDGTVQLPALGGTVASSGTGELTFHGVTNRVPVELHTTLSESGLIVTATIPISLSSFGLSDLTVTQPTGPATTGAISAAPSPSGTTAPPSSAPTGSSPGTSGQVTATPQVPSGQQSAGQQSAGQHSPGPAAGAPESAAPGSLPSGPVSSGSPSSSSGAAGTTVSDAAEFTFVLTLLPG